MAVSGTSALQDAENQRDLGTGRAPRHTEAMTAATAAAPAGGTGATAGAYDSAANRNTAIALINNNAARIVEIETKLKDLGILVAP